MKKQLISLIMLTMLLLSMMAFLGNVQMVGASTIIHVPSDYSTIQAAINHASPGDTVLVSAGTYNEEVDINKSVKVLGSGAGSTFIDGTGVVLTSAGLVKITAPGNVTFEGFTVENAPLDSNNNTFGIWSESGTSGVTYTILNNTIIGTGNTNPYVSEFGFYSYDDQANVVFKYNTITNTGGNNIVFECHTGTTDISYNNLEAGVGLAADSIFFMTYNGIDVNSLQNISYNTFNMGTGSVFDYDHRSSAISICTPGAAYGVGDAQFTNVLIQGNTIKNLKSYRRGISFWNGGGTGGGIIDPDVDNNIITGTNATESYGIDFIATGSSQMVASNATVMFNTISGTAYGIYLRTNSCAPGAQICHNNIAGNIVGLNNTAESSLVDAQYNWWGSSTGPYNAISNPSGMGDPVDGNVDYASYLTSPVPTTFNFGAYKTAIVKAADRLVALQSSTDYGWDWVVTGLTSHSTNPSATNLFGVTALGLLDAYVKTDDPTYLTAAQSTANFMMYGDASNGDFYYGHDSYYWGFSFDYKFLVEFSTLWGNSSYNNYALAAWAWEKANLTRYADGNQNMIWNKLVNNWVGTGYYGIGAWQASDYGLAAWEMGDTVWAQQMANVINANISNIALPFTPPYIATNYTNDDVNLGMAWALKLLVTVDPVLYASSITKLENQLLSNQLFDGSWGFNSTTSPGDTQTTAYVVMALWAAGEYNAAQRGAEWLLSTQLPNGGWFESPDEYSEIDSEVLQALVTAIPTPSYTITDYENAIASSANRLVALQSPTDYGWDWYVTGLTSHSASPSPSNLYGVTAIGLIDAYDKTGNVTYLTAAENTADFMMYGNPSNGDFFNGHGSYTWGRSSDYTFLIDLSAVTNNSTYKDYALAAWAWQKANATDARLGGTGQLAWADGNQSILFYDLVNYWVGPGHYGLASWEASDWGLAALAMGDTSWAMNMAAVINANVANIALPYTPPYIAANYTNDYVNMGIAWALELLITVDPVTYASSITTLKNQLLSNQLSDGSWSNWFLDTPPGESQTTAYAVMALITAHEYAAARKGADWLMSTQFTDGGWSSCPSEYSEPDSEDMQALASSIPQLTVVSAFNSPVPNGTTMYFAGTSITANVTSPVSGPAGTRHVCTGWSGTESVPSSGTGTSVTFNITQDSDITWNWKTQCNVTFDATGVGKDFTGTVVTIDGTKYGVTDLPVSFWYDNGSSHSFSFASQLVVNVNKIYVWNFTSGLTTLQSDPLTVTASGYVVGNYIIKNAITFDTIGVSKDFNGTVVTIDSIPYNFSSLPVSFYWTPGSKHSFVFQSPLVVAANTKQYVWTGTTGLSSLQSGSITVTTYGIIVGNYKTQYYLTLATYSLGINYTRGAGWYDSGTYASISAAQYVPAPGSSRYRFEGWTAIDMMEITNPSSTSTTVLIDKAKTVTANYAQIHCVAVTNIIPTWTAVPYGRTVPVNVTVTNQGDFPENVTITLEGSYFILSTETITNLQPGTTQTLIFNWNTTDFPEKDYRMLTNVALSPGETNTANNTFIDEWLKVTKIGNLGARVKVSSGVYENEFGVFTGQVTSVDLDLFLQCYHGTAPPQYMYLADLGSRVWNATANGGKGAYENEFFIYKVINGIDVVNDVDLNLELQLYNGIVHPDP